MGIAWSILHKIPGDERMAVLELTANNKAGFVKIHDGRRPRRTFHAQHIPYTDFPLEEVKLYITRVDEKNFVVMLTGEY